MKKTILSAASVLAIMAAAPAHADNMNTQADASAEVQMERTQQQNDDAVVTEQELKQGWEDTKDSVSNAASDVANATEETYEDIKAAFIDNDEDTEITNVTINPRNTATAMIGSTLYNTDGEAIATVSDIILDADGNATMAVVADGEIFGLGKSAAFDFSILSNKNADGDVIAPLSEEMIDQAAAFSYDAEDQSDDVRVVPANGYSVAELLEGQLVNAKGEAVADIDNISFSGSQAENLILGFNEVLGMGGNKAAMSFSEAQVVRDDSVMGGASYNFQLNADQAAQFESYKNQF